MKQKILIAAIALLLATTSAAGYLAYRSARKAEQELTITGYTLETALSQPIRILQLTDLHGHSFGPENAGLIDTVLSQQPDLIVMTGDMVDQSAKDAQTICALIRQLSETIPVWYGFGNHEITFMEETGIDLRAELTAAGATVVNCDYNDTEIKGQPLRIGGYHGYYRQPGMYPVTEEQRQAELSFADSFEATDRFKLLLCHIPTAWLDWQYIHKFPIDLVLSGHYHGGQIRLPLLGPLYAPYIGLFPEYTEGLFAGEQAVCVLSRGLAASPGLPRINNLPEITVIDLIPKA